MGSASQGQTPPGQQAAGVCRFCGSAFATCGNQCAESTRAFNAMREQINKVNRERKAKEAAAKSAEADK